MFTGQKYGCFCSASNFGFSLPIKTWRGSYFLPLTRLVIFLKSIFYSKKLATSKCSSQTNALMSSAHDWSDEKCGRVKHSVNYCTFFRLLVRSLIQTKFILSHSSRYINYEFRIILIFDKTVLVNVNDINRVPFLSSRD